MKSQEIEFIKDNIAENGEIDLEEINEDFETVTGDAIIILNQHEVATAEGNVIDYESLPRSEIQQIVKIIEGIKEKV